MFLILVGLFFGLNLMSGLNSDNPLAMWNMFAAGMLLVTAINRIFRDWDV